MFFIRRLLTWFWQQRSQQHHNQQRQQQQQSPVWRTFSKAMLAAAGVLSVFSMWGLGQLTLSNWRARAVYTRALEEKGVRPSMLRRNASRVSDAVCSVLPLPGLVDAPAGIQVERGIVYGAVGRNQQGKDAKLLKLDLYYSPSKARALHSIATVNWPALITP